MTFWNRRRKLSKTPSRPHKATVVDIESLVRRFLLDGRMAESQQLGTLIGLSPLDPETEAEEMAESDARARRLAHLVPIMSLLSSVMAGSVVEYLRTVSTGLQGLDDAEASGIADLIQQTCLSTSIGTVSQLEDLGLVRYTHSLQELT